MRRSSLVVAALALVGAALFVTSFRVHVTRSGCLVRDGEACVDDRLTGRAQAYVSSIDSDKDGRPVWYLEFEVDGERVQAQVHSWPATPGRANGARVGDTPTVAYDPAGPANHVTDAAALAAGAPAEDSGGGVLATLLRWTGLALLLAAWGAFVRRSRTARRAAAAVAAPAEGTQHGTAEGTAAGSADGAADGAAAP